MIITLKKPALAVDWIELWANLLPEVHPRIPIVLGQKFIVFYIQQELDTQEIIFCDAKVGGNLIQTGIFSRVYSLYPADIMYVTVHWEEW